MCMTHILHTIVHSYRERYVDTQGHPLPYSADMVVGHPQGYSDGFAAW